MVEWENYQMMITAIVPLYGTLFIAVYLESIGAPWWIGGTIFGTGYAFMLVWIIAQPKIMKLIAQGYKHKWFLMETTKADYQWPNRWQAWHKEDPAPHSKWLPLSQHWQTPIALEKAYRHKLYNGGREIFGIFLWHGGFSFTVPEGVEVTPEEIKHFSHFSVLFSDKPGYVMFGGMSVKMPHTSWAVLKEVLPTAEQLEEAERAILEGRDLRNHIPIVINGIAYPVCKVVRAMGSAAIEEDLANRITTRIPRLESENREASIPEAMIMRVPAE